jgi:hypothetical protein
MNFKKTLALVTVAALVLLLISFATRSSSQQTAEATYEAAMAQARKTLDACDNQTIVNAFDSNIKHSEATYSNMGDVIDSCYNTYNTALANAKAAYIKAS